jgi:hypothetical protein
VVGLEEGEVVVVVEVVVEGEEEQGEEGGEDVVVGEAGEDIGEGEDIAVVAIITGLIIVMTGLIGIIVITGPHGITQMQDIPETVPKDVIPDTKVVSTVAGKKMNVDAIDDVVYPIDVTIHCKISYLGYVSRCISLPSQVMKSHSKS